MAVLIWFLWCWASGPGTTPAMVTPEKTVDPKLFHHVLSPQFNGFECKKCSAFAVDINDLKTVPCVRESASSGSECDMKTMVDNQTKKLDQMRKLMELQELEKKLNTLVAKRDEATAPSTRAATPAAGLPATSEACQDLSKLENHFTSTCSIHVCKCQISYDRYTSIYHKSICYYPVCFYLEFLLNIWV